ncbi:MAG TPA: hypothetical protein VIM31_00205 [Candidatus Microsaccharimonas sp.]
MGEKQSDDQIEHVFELLEKNITEEFRSVAIKYGPIDPSELPLVEDQDLVGLFQNYDNWVKIQQKKVDQAGGTIEAHLKMALKVTPFFVEVGFTDPSYVDEVVNDWMAQDLAQAEDAGLDDIAVAIRNKMEQLQGLLPKST